MDTTELEGLADLKQLVNRLKDEAKIQRNAASVIRWKRDTSIDITATGKDAIKVADALSERAWRHEIAYRLLASQSEAIAKLLEYPA